MTQHPEQPEQLRNATPPLAPRLIKRVGAYGFLTLIMLPAVLLMGLAYLTFLRNLADIENVAIITNTEHLPGILASQRTLINIENMRRSVETTYTSPDLSIRREASLNATALSTESIFEPDSRFAEYASTAAPLIRQLLDAKARSDKAEDNLHFTEVELTRVTARLSLRAGAQNKVTLSHSSRHIPSPNTYAADAFAEAERKIAPLFALCGTADAPPPENMREDCAAFHTSWENLDISWKELVQADSEARSTWKQLDDILRELSDRASSAEAALTYTAMEHISTEAHRARIAFYFSALLLGCILVSFLIAMHHYILAPLALASRNLRRIRYGLPAEPVSPVRIRELQEMLDLLPSLSDHLTALAARSGKLEQEKDAYANLSLVDGLTGVSNRRNFDIRLAAEDRHHPLAVLMIDVDMFKLFNDTYGHQAGDKALIDTAKAMEKSLLRASDRVFRYGGEEFTVILPDATEESALAVATRILFHVRSLEIPHPTSPVAPVLTVSVGVALRKSWEVIDDAGLVARADKALYRAKSSGRNQVYVSGHADEQLAQSSLPQASFSNINAHTPQGKTNIS